MWASGPGDDEIHEIHEGPERHEEVVAVAVNDGSRTIVVVVDGDVEVTTVQVDGPPSPDLAVVATLARLRLMARRMGWTIRLEDPCPRLCELLEFVGLGDLLLDRAPDLRADDVVDLRDLCDCEDDGGGESAGGNEGARPPPEPGG
jgi:hypothetical protein